MTISRWAALAALLSTTWGCRVPTGNPSRPEPASPSAPAEHTEASPERAGLLLMAHGGDPEWNGRVAAAVEGLRDRMPVAIAFGMADPRTLQAALDSLVGQSVEYVAVVRDPRPRRGRPLPGLRLRPLRGGAGRA